MGCRLVCGRAEPMTTNGLTERQKIDACLSCRLPECIPDHPRCPVSGVVVEWDKDRRTWLCMNCQHGTLILTADPDCRFYWRCAGFGSNSAGLHKHCGNYHLLKGLTAWRKKTERGGVTNATRYHAVQTVRR